MNLHVVAYPELQSKDYDRIQQYRREYNSLYSIIEPHCTLVFAVADMSLPEFTAEVKRQVADVKLIHFCLRCAVVNKDATSDYYDAFLVPDEGHSHVVKLHDRLYAGTLSRHHRLDIPYVPHISIANALDPMKIKAIVDEWNRKEFAIEGAIKVVDIINYENRVITTMEQVFLQGA